MEHIWLHSKPVSDAQARSMICLQTPSFGCSFQDGRQLASKQAHHKQRVARSIPNFQISGFFLKFSFSSFFSAWTFSDQCQREDST